MNKIGFIFNSIIFILINLIEWVFVWIPLHIMILLEVKVFQEKIVEFTVLFKQIFNVAFTF